MDAQTIFLFAVAFLFQAFVFGALSYTLAGHKGYHNSYFWIGVFLGIIGLWYVGFLPIKAADAPKQTESQDETPEEEYGHYFGTEADGKKQTNSVERIVSNRQKNHCKYFDSEDSVCIHSRRRNGNECYGTEKCPEYTLRKW